MKQQIEDLKDELFYLSIKKENKQQSYLSNLPEQHNKLNGVVYKMSYTLKKEQLQKVKERQQQIYAIVNLANKKNLKAIFLTLTVPANYHPFIHNQKTGKIIKSNPRFKFYSIDEAVKPSYEKLKKTYRDFYKQVKKIDNDLLYLKVYEPHKTLIPHLHMILFVSPSIADRVKKIFFKTIDNNDLIRVDFDETFLVDKIDKPQAYIMKYLFKTTMAENDYIARWLDGWRRKYQIRILEASQLPMNLEVYRSLYYALPKELKEEIDKEIEKNKSNYFEYFMQNTDIDIQIVDEENTLISHRRVEQGTKIRIL